MKRWLIILLCAALLLLGGCKETPEPTTEPVTATTETTWPTEPATQPTTQPPTEPTETEPPVTEPPEPETEASVALADRTELLLAEVSRGTVLELVGEFDPDYYVVKLEDAYGLIEKRLVRGEGAEPYASWEGYAKSGAKLYDNYRLLPGDTTESLSRNTKLTVLEELGEVCLVRRGETEGYMRRSDISKTYIESKPSGGSADGGDISLGGIGGFQRLSVLVPRDGAVTGKVQILVDRASILLGWFDRGDPVPVITESGFLEEKEGFVPVYLEGFAGYVRQELLRTPETEAYTAWEGYARSGAEVYGSYYLDGEALVSLSGNTRVQILEDLGFCYLVTAGETTGYMEKDQISETKINYSTGGGGEWSDPVM